MTGIPVDNECVSSFTSMKMQRTNKFITFKIADDQSAIVTDVMGGPDATHEDFINALPMNEARYAVYHLNYETKDGLPASKHIFIIWTGPSTKLRNRVIYTASKEAIKNAIEIEREIQATDIDAIQYESIVATIRR
ncbi:hypothetical protein PCE1_000374 [Barthelona sp. PCE]